MTTAFTILMGRCGLRRREAAEFLGVAPETIDAWAAGSTLTPSVVAELRALYRKIVHTGRELGEVLRIGLEQQSARHIAIGIVEDDGEARACGFPCAGAHAAAVGIAIMLLPDDVTVDLVPWSFGSAPTATARHAGAIRDQLIAARRRRAELERRLAASSEFRTYMAAPDAVRATFEAPLRRDPDFIRWQSLTGTIRELETLAKSRGPSM
jgi:hypothetical protein